MLRTSTKPNRCQHCKARMPDDKARHVLHEECIKPWQEKREAKREAKRKADLLKEKKIERAETKRRKAANMTPSEHKERTEKAVNESVRWRDYKQGCISCGAETGVMQAGHYRSVKAAPHLRFDLRNIHKQCTQCNLFESGNLIQYRLGFVARYGVEAVDAVECDNTPRHYSTADLEVIREEALARTKQLKREME